jgi:Elongation factor Tu GTP binding domain
VKEGSLSRLRVSGSLSFFASNYSLANCASIDPTLMARSMLYSLPNDPQPYLLNLVDTPGHVDFSAEVSRSLLAVQVCGGISVCFNPFPWSLITFTGRFATRRCFARHTEPNPRSPTESACERARSNWGSEQGVLCLVLSLWCDDQQELRLQMNSA